MRRLLTTPCAGGLLAMSLDAAEGATGVLIVTGGSQTRIGSHRMFERLAAGLAAEGFPVLRFDRRGVGDSEGADPGFRGSGPDIAAAASALPTLCPALKRMVGLGLCDGATALAFHGAAAGLDALILVNPWLVEAEAGAPPAAAVKRHYLRRLTSREGWARILSGSISWRKLFDGLSRIATERPSGLGAEVAAALDANPRPLAFILARNDHTSIASLALITAPIFTSVCSRAAPLRYIDTDSHTFAHPGDAEALLAACLEALRRF